MVDQLHNLSIKIAIAASEDSQIRSSFDFNETLNAICELVEKTDVDAALLTNNSVPGYLSREVDGCKIFVPMNLAYVSPPHSTLISLKNLSSNIKIRLESHTCISGSATFLGRTDNISDIDFAEYFEEEKFKIQDYFSEFVQRDRHAQFNFRACEVRFSELGKVRDHQLPFSNCLRALSNISWRQIHLDAHCEFLSIGPIPASSKVLPTPANEFSDYSFVYQEIVVVKNLMDKPTRSLADHDHLRSYIDFLYKEAIFQANKKPVKALKRSIALLSLMCYRQDAERGMRILESIDNSYSEMYLVREFVQQSTNKISSLLRTIEA